VKKKRKTWAKGVVKKKEVIPGSGRQGRDLTPGKLKRKKPGRERRVGSFGPLRPQSQNEGGG